MVDGYTFEHNFEFVIFSGLLKKTGVDKGRPFIAISFFFYLRSYLDDLDEMRSLR